MNFTCVSIPKTIIIRRSKVFVTSSPATILVGFADIVLFVVDSEIKQLLQCKYSINRHKLYLNILSILEIHDLMYFVYL